MSRVNVTARIGAKDGKRIAIHGRDAWALLQLIAADVQGVTPIERVGPRWSAYVHKLRKAGISIVTIHESHGGQFPGRHARYVLSVPVYIDEPSEATA